MTSNLCVMVRIQFSDFNDTVIKRKVLAYFNWTFKTVGDCAPEDLHSVKGWNHSKFSHEAANT